MNKKMLMLMANSGRGEKGRRVGVEYEDWGVKDHYPMTEPYSTHWPMEDKFRDRRGREHYDDGRYAPMSVMKPEDLGYRWGSDGRFTPRSDYNDPWMHRRMSPTYDDRGERKMNPIGFARDGSDATVPQYHEMERMDGDGMSRGYSRSEYMPHFDRQMAEEWMSGLQNEDGTTGPHWNMRQSETVMAQKEIGGSPLAFWVALNIAYSDYCNVAKKLGLGGNMDFYVYMAEAFLNDKDSIGGGGAEKLARYYDSVVQH